MWAPRERTRRTRDGSGSGARRATRQRVRYPVSLLLCALLAPTIAHAQPTRAPLRIAIEDALKIAVGVSHPLAAARAEVDAARADVVAARSTYFPQIGVSGSYVRTLASEFDAIFATDGVTDGTGDDGPIGGMFEGDVAELPFGRDHIWNVGFDVTQQIWDGGRTRANVDLAEASRDLASLDFRSQRAQTILETAQAYYGAVLAAEAVKIGEAALALAERTLEVARVGYEQGTSAEFDVVRAEVTRDNERTALVRARAERDIALVRLKQRLGIPVDQPVELTSRLHAGGALEVASSLAEIDREPVRTAVAQARTAVDAAEAQVNRFEAERWPQLTAFSSLGFVQYPRHFLPDEDWRRNWTIGVNINLPLFTGFRRTAQIRSAKASRRSAQAQLAQVKELAVVDERTTQTDVAVAAATVRAQKRSAELAQRAADIAEVRYEQGVSTLLELTDARLALVRAQLNLATAARDLQVARVRLQLLPALPLPGELVATATPVTIADIAITTETDAAAAGGGRTVTGAGAAQGTVSGLTSGATSPELQGGAR